MATGSGSLLKSTEIDTTAETTVEGEGTAAAGFATSGPKLRIAFNGKFLSAAPTGVHRVAAEMIVALDRRLRTSPDLKERIDAVVLAPQNATRTLDLSCIRVKKVGMLTGQFWEQLELPFRTQGRILVSLCNLGPVASRRAVTMIHDAQVHITPASYSAAFRLFYRTMQPLMGRRHRRILTVSEFSRQQLDKAGVASKDKIHVIHNGTDHVAGTDKRGGLAREFGLTPRKFVLGLANTQPHKNISVLLKAFADPALASFQLALFGKTERSDFEAAGHLVPQNVHFLGAIPDDTLVELMQDALCLAFPSTTEGFGLPPLEAMRVGCPALVSPCGALPEVCGDAADYVPPDRPQAWCHAIAGLDTNSEKWRAMSKSGLAHADAFTWDKAAGQLVSVLDTIALE